MHNHVFLHVRQFITTCRNKRRTHKDEYNEDQLDSGFAKSEFFIIRVYPWDQLKCTRG